MPLVSAGPALATSMVYGTAPPLTAADRDPRELAAAAVVSVTVPTDLLEIV